MSYSERELRQNLEQSRMIDYLVSTYYFDDDSLLLYVFYFGFSALNNEYINAPEATTRDNTYAPIIASILRVTPLPGR